jgi:hypothetical protein
MSSSLLGITNVASRADVISIAYTKWPMTNAETKFRVRQEILESIDRGQNSPALQPRDVTRQTSILDNKVVLNSDTTCHHRIGYIYGSAKRSTPGVTLICRVHK